MRVTIQPVTLSAMNRALCGGVSPMAASSSGTALRAYQEAESNLTRMCGERLSRPPLQTRRRAVPSELIRCY